MRDPFGLVNLAPLMARTEGAPGVSVALVDGPVAVDHAALPHERVRTLGDASGTCAVANSAACRHGTLVAGVLAARRGTGAAALCPGCTLLVRPIFAEAQPVADDQPAASPSDLAAALRDCLAAGAWIVNLSAALVQPSLNGERALQEALDAAARRGTLIIAAAGNQGAVGGTAITRHPWVLPVAACDGQGRPLAYTNLSASIGRRGLLSPGQGVTGLDAAGGVGHLHGTSAATPVVAGAAALLWSEFPRASAAQVRLALTQSAGPRRSVVPPLLNAGAAYRMLANSQKGVA